MGFELILISAILGAGLFFWYLLPIPTAKFLLLLERRRSGLASEHLQVGKTRWHYLDTGETGKEVLVTLHGIGADGDNWTRGTRYLNHRFRVVAPDLPGFGDSDHPLDSSFAVHEQARRLKQFADALGLKRFHLAGNSMGGMIAACFARLYPETMISLWLLAPGGIVSSKFSVTLQQVWDGGHNPLVVRNAKDFRELMDLCFYQRPFIPYPVNRYLTRRAIRIQSQVQQVFDELRFDSDTLETIADGLAVPTLIVWGKNDQVLDVSGANILADLMPNSELIIVDELGHIPMTEKPQMICQQFIRFAEELSRRPAARPEGLLSDESE